MSKTKRQKIPLFTFGIKYFTAWNRESFLQIERFVYAKK
jgi:hypothetical protein